MVHASADPDYATDLVCTEIALRGGQQALLDGAPIITDVRMVASGITARHAVGEVICLIDDPRTARLAAEEGITRAAAGVRLTHEEVGDGAIWVIGNAPTAVLEILAIGVRPALVIGLPVGFIAAAESKAQLLRSGLPSVTNRSAKGGSSLAAAALNALLYADLRSPEPAHRGPDPAHSSQEQGHSVPRPVHSRPEPTSSVPEVGHPVPEVGHSVPEVGHPGSVRQEDER